MLRRELVSPRARRQLARTCATWSLGALIVGGAVLDATVFSKEPTHEQVNVEIQLADPVDLPAAAPVIAEDTIDELILRGADPGTRVMWLPADAHPHNRITADGVPYTLRHAAGDGVELEIDPAVAPEGTVACADRLQVDDDTRGLPARGYFPDGEYLLRTDCDGGPVTETRLIVQHQADR